MAAVTGVDGLAVLDFSGTLSLGAARFATAERLAGELRRSGLADLGIASPEAFWEVLVNPTWDRGSTTPDGYVTVLSAAAATHLRDRGADVDDTVVRTAVQRFADAYLAASRIDDAWRPWLHRLADVGHVAVVVATDHYAEATAHIVAELERLDVRAAPVDGDTSVTGAVVLVANSADIGWHKRDAAFWDPVVDAVGTVGRVAVADDFGANEAEGDAYAQDARVQRRRRATAALLADVFDAEVSTCPFVVADGHDVGAVVRDVAGALVVALSPRDGGRGRLP